MAKSRKGIVDSADFEGISVSELLALLLTENLEDLAVELQAAKRVRKLQAVASFERLLFSILSSERLSLSEVEANFQDLYFATLAKLVHPGEVRWTGIREKFFYLNCGFACTAVYAGAVAASAALW